MINSTSTRERRDWALLIFIIPIGILLMLAAGQVAIRLVPEWSVNAGMQSNLDPNRLPKQQSAPIQPILPAILTPLGWFDTFLTPGAGSGDQLVFPPFVVFEPSATPEVTLPPPTTVTVTTTPATPTTPATNTPPSATSSPPPVTPTKKPTDEPTSTPPTVVPTATPPTIVPTATPPTPTNTPVPTPVPVVSTPTGTNVIPPAGIVGSPDLSIYNLNDGTYAVVNLGSTPIIVRGTSYTNYDLVYYELLGCTGICMDQVIIGISNDPSGGYYYEVFNWGNGVADTNSNVGDVAGAETDNQPISTSELYGTFPLQTGVLIDVDNAPSNPPPDSYQYLVIQAPVTSANDGTDINSVNVVDVPP